MNLTTLRVTGPPAASGLRSEMQTFAWRADGVFSRSGLLIGASGATAHGRVALELNLDEFDIGSELGRGSSSVVWRATHMRTGAVVAIKRVRLNTHASREALVSELRALWAGDDGDDAGANVSVGAGEANAGANLGARAPRALVNTLLGACARDGAVYLALEYMDAGSLENVCLRAGGPLPERALSGIAYCLFSALAALTEMRRLHRDVKPSNVLLDSSGAVALSDFGLARTLDAEGKAHSFVGTQRFLAPERLRGETYDCSADVWAAGVTLWSAATGRHPFMSGPYADMGPIELTAAILSEPSLATPDDCTFSQGLTELIFNATRRDPDARLTAVALLGSPWFLEHGVRDVDDAIRVVREYFSAVASGSVTHSAARLSSGSAATRARPSPTASDARAALQLLLSEKDETGALFPVTGGTFEII